jgi:hypothetical protein
MYHLTFHNSEFIQSSMFMGLIMILIINNECFLKRTELLIFVMENFCVLFEVGTSFFKLFRGASYFGVRSNLKLLFISENNHKLTAKSYLYAFQNKAKNLQWSTKQINAPEPCAFVSM